MNQGWPTFSGQKKARKLWRTFFIKILEIKSFYNICAILIRRSTLAIMCRSPDYHFDLEIESPKIKKIAIKMNFQMGE
jgi:hypothetical protein